MDGTMIDSMPFHAKSWIEFARRHALGMDVAELLRRTTGRTGIECMCEVFERDVAPGEALALIHEKEAIYRELFAPAFAEVGGFRRFAAAAMDLGYAPFGIEAARRAGMRAVAICTSHDAHALAGAHVVAQACDYHQLRTKNFLESLDA